MQWFSKLREKIKLYIEVAKADSLARRYFVLNVFDGVITVFSIVLASYATGVANCKLVLLTGLSACFAMGMSGFFGAYMSEKAERERHTKTLEETKEALHPLHHEAAKFIPFYLAFIDCIASIIVAVPLLSPFILVNAGILSLTTAYLLTLPISMVILFLMGVYLGRVSGRNHWSYGITMLAIGMMTAILILLTRLWV
jgi:predicted membrane protein (TIGR00267 family)